MAEKEGVAPSPPRFPAPYRAALTLSIDCDGCTVPRLEEVFRYWATDEATPFGPGLRLPVSSSFFLYSRNPAAPPQSAYLDGDRERLREAFRRGWLDTLHSVGDFSRENPCTRDLARRGFEALAEDGLRIRVWTNHGGPENNSNLVKAGAGGDLEGGPAYLADLAEAYGIQFFWISELTHLVGQDRPAGAGEYYATYPGRSGAGRLLLRAAHGLATGAVRKLGAEPYPGNRLVEERRLRDGRPVLAFRRYGRWRHDTISRLPSILPPAVLDRLIQEGGAMAVYLHIGPSADETPENFRAGLKVMDDVARRFREGALWVARTVDLLDHTARREGLARPVRWTGTPNSQPPPPK